MASVINKALAGNVAEKNNFGIFTPLKLYESLSQVKYRDLPTAKGNKARLAEELSIRKKIIAKLQKQKIFSSIDYAFLENTAENSEKTIEELKSVALLAKTNLNHLDAEAKKEILKLVYSYTVELDLFLQIEATNLYKNIYAAFK